MEFDEVQQLIDLMNKNDLSEMEIEKEGLKIRLKKNTQDVVTVSAPAAGVPAAAPAQTGAGSEKEEEAVSKSGLIPIASPIVGTFYEAASPDANPYVEIGDVVEADTVVCIVEAMKVMNEIKAETEGRIEQRLVSNGEAVEFGQTLFLVNPNI